MIPFINMSGAFAFTSFAYFSLHFRSPFLYPFTFCLRPERKTIRRSIGSRVFSRNHAKRLQPHVVAAERVFKVHRQFFAIAIGRAAIQPAGIRTEEEQAAATCRRTCRAFAIVRHSRRHMGIHFKVRRSLRYARSRIFPMWKSLENYINLIRKNIYAYIYTYTYIFIYTYIK